MEKFTFCLRGALAKRLERLSTSHGPGYLDYLLEAHTPDTDLPPAPPPPPRPVTDWAPKIGVDDLTKSIEIDVGSQVIVVNLSDFYKPRDAAQLFGAPADDVANGAASGLDLLASTANMYRSRGGGGGSAGKKAGASRFTCALCQTRCTSQAALRVHYGSAHGQQLHGCHLCGQSFIRRRDLEKHECDEEDPVAAGGGGGDEPRVPPLVVRPPKSQQPRRLEDSSSEDEDDPVPRPPPPRRPPPLPQPANKKRQDGKKEAYVCRVCQSKFRDPQSVLQHLKQFHREHAMKAWSKFQENLRTRQPEPSAGRGRGRGAATAAAAHVARTADTFAVRSVTGAPMKLKLSRSQQQQQELRRRQQEEGAEPEEYAVLPSEIPALRPGQRDPIYHQTQYRVYQPPDPPPQPPASPPLDSGPPPANTSPGYVTCGVCGGTKYYTYTEQCRLYGSSACEACRKFVARQPQTQPVQCQLGLGQCHIPVLVPRNSADTRCRACWLKKSLMAFNMPQEKHDRFRECLPPSIRDTVPTFAVKPYKETGVCERDTLE